MLERLKVPVGWGELFKRAFWESIADDVPSLAAQQAYFFFFALFPALLAMISIASFFPIDNLIDEVVGKLNSIAPKEVIGIITNQMKEISETGSGGILTIAFLFTLWSSSNAMLAMVTTLNVAYDITESRPWWKTRLLAIGLTVGMALFILISMALIIAGPTFAEQVADTMRLGPAFEWTWKIAQWPVVFVLVVTAIALVYYFAPDARQDWIWITPGSVLATVLWIVISLGLKTYMSVAGSYEETYGVIGGVMVLMLWFYLSGLAILIGAELNAEIEHASPYGKDPGEKVPGELKAIGPMAQREYEARVAKGEIPETAFAEGVNCDIDRPRARAEKNGLRPSDLLIGTAVLLPAALKIGKEIRDKAVNGHHERDAA
jgi:membrane protein